MKDPEKKNPEVQCPEGYNPKDKNNIENILKQKGLIEDLKKLVDQYRNDYLKSSSIFASKVSFKIGDLQIIGPVIAAPLAGISDNTFRIFAKAFGSSLSFTEMISAYGIHYKNRETEVLSYISGFERPCGIQLFGSEPDILLEAAQLMEERADIIDINMGCPVPKVLKTGSGGILLNDEIKIGKIISRISSKIKKPLTLKTRLGWDKNSINIERVASIAQENGAAAIVIHGRTVKQGFTGEADYSWISRIKSSLEIPVIASGDIDTPLKAYRILKDTGCDAVMIGRALKGRHWILSNIAAGIFGINADGVALDPFLTHDASPTLEFRKSYAGLYLKFMIAFKGEEKALREFRKVLMWIFKGMHGISLYKNDFFTLESAEDAARIISSINP